MMFQPSYMQMFCNNHGLKVLHQRSFICHSCMSQNFVFINNIFGSSCHVACISSMQLFCRVVLSCHSPPHATAYMRNNSLSVTARMSTCQSGKHPGGVTLCDHPPPPPKNSSYFFSTYVFPFFTAKPNELPIQARLQKCPCLLTLTIKYKTFVCR